MADDAVTITSTEGMLLVGATHKDWAPSRVNIGDQFIHHARMAAAQRLSAPSDRLYFPLSPHYSLFLMRPILLTGLAVAALGLPRTLRAQNDTAGVAQQIRDLEQKINASYAANDLPTY